MSTNPEDSVAAVKSEIHKHVRSLAINMGDIKGKTICEVDTGYGSTLTLMFTDGTYINIEADEWRLYNMELEIADAIKFNLVSAHLVLSLQHEEEQHRTWLRDNDFTGHRDLRDAVRKLGRAKVDQLLKEASE